MKTMKIILSAVVVVSILSMSSCYKANDNPFHIYFLSTQENFPNEIHVIYNKNFIGDVKKIHSENIAEISRMKSGLKTLEQIIDLTLVDNKNIRLCELRFSLLPDGTYKKVSSSGALSFDVKTIESYKFAIFFKKVD
jgi:hypothetical protein